jgi:hypothetical protein
MEWRGAALEVQSITAPEWMISGPSETGKTVAALYRIDRIARQNPGARIAIIRKVRKTITTTVAEIYRRLFVDGKNLGVSVFGGQTPEWFDYSNGSRIGLYGMDDPGKLLGGELDVVYFNQAEQADLDDWEMLATRTTGRAGHVKHPMICGDCNPDAPGHWILARADAGTLHLMHSRHKDNPSLYTAEGELTEQGTRTVARLAALTGVRGKRLRDGLWVQAEGTVYADQWDDTDPTLVTKDAEYDPARGDVFLACDDGYAGEFGEDGFPTATSHPRTFLLAQLDSTGTLNIFHEQYRLRTLPEADLDELKKTCEGYKIEWPPYMAVVDKSATVLKRRLADEGVRVVNSPPSVDESIKVVREWMAKDENGKRRVRVHPRCRILRREFSTYAYGADGKIVKAFDHGPDDVRYQIWALRRFE